MITEPASIAIAGSPPPSEAERLGLKEKISYGLGEAASNLSWAVMTSFLLFFYTNIALLPVAALGTLFLTSRIIDALADPAIGALVDRTRSRYGKARPYLLYASVPFAIWCVITFYVPDISPDAKVVYAYVTFITLGLAYSALTIPYSALLPMMTLDPDERMQLSSLRVIGSQLGTIVVTSLTLPLVALLGGSSQKLGFALTMAVFAFAGTILYLAVFANCRERYSLSAPKDASTLSEISRMFRNRIWLVTFSFLIFGFIRLGIIPAATVFYAMEVLRKPWAVSLLLPLMGGSFLLGAFVAPPLFKWLGKRWGNIITLLATIVFYGAMSLLQNHIIPFLVAYVLATISMGLGITSLYAMTAEAVDFHEWKFRSRPEGLLVSSISFGVKIGMAIGSALVAYVLAWAGYDPKHVTNHAASAIAWVYLGGPVLLIVAQIVCVAFYDIDKKHPQIVAEIRRRRGLQP